MELNKPLATLTPTLDGEILAVLANSDTTFTPGRMRKVLGRYSEEGIRRVLSRLAGQGVVHVERVGNAFVHRLNRDHLAAEHIIGLSRLREAFLARLGQHLKSWSIRPVHAAVFGAAARGTMAVDGDVDLFLVRPDGADGDQWDTQVAHLVTEVARWTGNGTRTLEFTEAEVRARADDEPVLREVLDEGLVVAGTRSWLVKRLRKKD